MTEAPASCYEVAYWVLVHDAKLILSQDYKGEGWLVLKSRRIIPVFQRDMHELSVYGWVTHHIHMTPPERMI